MKEPLRPDLAGIRLRARRGLAVCTHCATTPSPLCSACGGVGSPSLADLHALCDALERLDALGVPRRVRQFVNARLDSLLTRPGLWGPPEAVELQVLHLLDVLYVLARPDDARPQVVLGAYRAFLHRHFPDDLPVFLATRLEATGRVDELPALLGAFRARTPPRRATPARSSRRSRPRPTPWSRTPTHPS